MFLAIVATLLVFALFQHGFAPPGTMAFRIKSAIIATFLVLGYCSSIQEFWYALKQPAEFSEAGHIFNRYFPSSVPYVKGLSSIVGTMALFAGFALAHRKRAVSVKVDTKASGYYLQMQPDGPVKLVPSFEAAGATR